MDNQDSQDLKINISEDIAEGNYSNLAIISYSSSEFVLDFVKVLPGLSKTKVQTRAILAPEHVKRLLQTLQENVSSYEKQYGIINLPYINQNRNKNTPFTPPISGFNGEA